jgi:predicted nucleic acid-binding protein
MRTIVPDASVILKWRLDSANEPDAARARVLLERWRDGDLTLLVPSLWAYEVGAVLHRKVPNDALESLLALMDLGLEELPLDRALAQSAARLSTRFAVTFYDAAYLAAAERRGGTLVTADARFAARLPESDSVVLLRDWEAPGR